ncbi:hypothetical protein EXN66_Car011950 [Channa argus]|uniref:Uncharacterized protein n=1 Tax=Channa argus TaxID=215402 RepID=A0A6G1Q1L8_CHAAH|nr:hypothetical protein EXN66_Car011950 [Channa argus]
MSLTLCVFSRSCLCPSLSPSLCPFLQVSPGFEAVCFTLCSYWSYQPAQCFVVSFYCSFSFLSSLSTHPNRSRQMAAHPEPGSAGGFFC